MVKDRYHRYASPLSEFFLYRLHCKKNIFCQVEGNTAGKCSKCRKAIKSYNGITGLQCRWCHMKVKIGMLFINNIIICTILITMVNLAKEKTWQNKTRHERRELQRDHWTSLLLVSHDGEGSLDFIVLVVTRRSLSSLPCSPPSRPSSSPWSSPWSTPAQLMH